MILRQQIKAEPSLPNVKKNDLSKISHPECRRAAHHPAALGQEEYRHQGYIPRKLTTVRQISALGGEKHQPDGYFCLKSKKPQYSLHLLSLFI